jgi:hypothetical protein
MKTIKLFFGIILAASLCLFAVSCGKDSPSVSDTNKKILTTTTWNLQTLTVDGVDKTKLYTGMTLSFDATTYTTAHGQPVWPLSGTWTFTDDSGKNILRDGAVAVVVESITADELVLSLTWDSTTFGAGRTASVAGNHIYTFIK